MSKAKVEGPLPRDLTSSNLSDGGTVYQSFMKPVLMARSLREVAFTFKGDVYTVREPLVRMKDSLEKEKEEKLEALRAVESRLDDTDKFIEHCVSYRMRTTNDLYIPLSI